MDTVALKIQRRRYSKAAVHEVSIHHLIRRETGPCADIVALREAFLHEGHVCMAYEKLNGSIEDAIEDGPLDVGRVRIITRQLLHGLERLHRCGYAHTDLKPDNILYDSQTGAARLADLGSADRDFRQGSSFGTRGYIAPEGVIGSPLGTAADMWSLACTVFEMLTARRLFDPRRSAGKKYREFSDDDDSVEIPLAESAKADEAAEDAEQYKPGAILAGKYALKDVLGQGRFGTVWAAETLSGDPLDGTYKTLWGYAQNISSSAASPEIPGEREWRSARGADDILDLALNYEYLLQIASLCAPIPYAMIQAARYRSGYFEADGALRFRPKIRRFPLSRRLGNRLRKKAPDFAHLCDFLSALLAVDPAARLSSKDALNHPWVAGEPAGRGS